jgi:hypothetical protein
VRRERVPVVGLTFVTSEPLRPNIASKLEQRAVEQLPDSPSADHQPWPRTAAAATQITGVSEAWSE